ncbi:MAG TPA: cell division protein FtsZ [Thermotogota bacterium]|nr:cell division protein FtsZ [Thermotogota bacterium]HRW91394.1 cell division protein FtsZ [Thermotogota bacterium]
MPFEIDDGKDLRRQPRRNPTIKVIGVGGAGNNAVNRMIESGIHGVIFVVANTDLQVLEDSKADIKIQLGKELTRGLGAGGNPEKGEKAAFESKEEILSILEDTDMLFITAGLGGGTGTGAAPVIAKLAREAGILTIGVVTTPFYFEGKNRWENAKKGLVNLREHVDTLIKISNNKLLEEFPGDITVMDGFLKADEALHQGIKGISEVITRRGLINQDFADIESVMREAGVAFLGIGIGKGEERAQQAAIRAMDSKLLERPVDNATAVILNISSNQNITMREMNLAAAVIRQRCSETVDMKFGLILDEDLPEDEVRVTLIATKFEDSEELLSMDGDIPAVYRMGLTELLRGE